MFSTVPPSKRVSRLMHAARYWPSQRTTVYRWGLGGLRERTWPRITDIGLRPYGRTVTIMVTAAGGGRFRLAAPLAGRVMGDPGFAGQTEQILSYWRETTERPPAGGNPAALGSLLPGIADRAASPASVSEGTGITLAAADHGTGACTGPGGSASP
jgi:hypothetical protein